MKNAKFVYVTYISAAPEKIWSALTDPEMTRMYWQHENISDWKPGSRWEHRRSDTARTLDMTGTVAEYTRPRRLALNWVAPGEENRPEKTSKVTLELEPYRGVTRLTVTHEALEAGSEMLEGITEGWPMVLSSLKTLMETGRPLPELWETETAELATAPGTARR